MLTAVLKRFTDDKLKLQVKILGFGHPNLNIWGVRTLTVAGPLANAMTTEQGTNAATAVLEHENRPRNAHGPPSLRLVCNIKTGPAL